MKIVYMERESLGRDVSIKRLDELGEVVVYDKSDDAENAERLRDCEIAIVNKIPMNAETLKYADKLKLICLSATGTNNIDFNYTNAHGIKVCNVKGYSTESVVQHTFAMLFYLFEHLPYYDSYVKHGAYAAGESFSHFGYQYNELNGKTYGIIGLGNIGRRVAEIAKAFGCRVIYYSTSGKHDEPGIERVSLEELLKQADIVSIHAPLNEKTFNLIGEKELRLMKPSSIILNLGRGNIIDEQALFDALVEDRIMGAGLDVLSKEPILESNPLYGFKNSNRLIITPHIGWGAVEARKRCLDEMYLNIQAFLNGEERNVVTSN